MDKIIIENLTVFANHGVMEEERSLGQKFVVSAIIEVDLHKAGVSDDLKDTLNYSQICHKITEYSAKNPCRLIETAAEKLAKLILTEYPSVRAVNITIRKPWAPIGLPLDSAGVSIERKRHTAYVALGSNMGDKQKFLDDAVKKIDEDKSCRVEKVSDFIVTKPVGGVAQDDFLNGCIKINTLYTPHELLEKLHEIENEAGRKREIHWGPRTLDLDIILYDDIIVDTDDLKIPHIETDKRRFVLEPLSQIAPYSINPITGMSAVKMLESLKKKQQTV